MGEMVSGFSEVSMLINNGRIAHRAVIFDSSTGDS
jgi:hypothetical protein